jgi:signal transduction histidine kinase
MRHLGRIIDRGPRRIALLGIIVLIPAVALGLLAFRAFRGEQAREEYQRRERQQQILRLLESDLSDWIKSWRESSAASEGTILFEMRENRVAFPHIGVYLFSDYRHELETRVSSRELQLWRDAQAAELRGSEPAETTQAYRSLLSRGSPLSSWSRLSLLRLSLQHDDAPTAAGWLKEIRDKDRQITTESGIPVWVAAALLLIDHGSVRLRQATSDFLAQVVAELAGGRWRLNAAQWVYYTREISAALGRPDPPGDIGVTADFLQSFAGAVHQILALRQSLELNPSRSFAALYLSEANGVVVLYRGKELDTGCVLGSGQLTREAQARLNTLTAAEDFAGGIRISDGNTQPSTATLAAFPFLKVLFSERDQALWRSHIRRYFIFYATALLLLVAGAGLVFTYRAVAREVEVSRMKAEFVSSVSHEFRTPLSAIDALLERMESGKVRDVEMLQRYYRASRQEVHRLTRMVNQLLDFARLEEGRSEFDLSTLDLNQLTTEAVQSFCNLGSGSRLVEALDQGTPLAVSADGNAIVQCIQNLIDNALKYSPKDSDVTVRTGRQEGTVFLEVADHGPGIAPEEQELIFEQFYRAGRKDAHRARGAGIGLALVKRVMEAHGGEVTLASRPGEGSTFRLSIPEPGTAAPNHEAGKVNE